MKQLTPQQTLELINNEDNILIVDARSADEYNISHIPHAKNIPLEAFATHQDILKNYDHVIVYCNTGNSSIEFTKKAHAHQITHVNNMVGGLDLWQKEGYPIIKNKSVLPIMRQVFIAAGGLVLIGIALRYTIHPYFLLMSLFVGGGLMFAGISGMCGMTKILALMPWNRTPDMSKQHDFSSQDKTIHIHQFEDEDLAHYSYALISQEHMIVIDPMRDPQPYYDYAEQHNAKIVGIIETHPHADFASGHLEIHETTGAPIYISKLAGATYPHTPFDDGENIQIGTATLSAINTPGHSPDSISILVEDQQGNQLAVFTGDTLFVGDVGRADLRESVGNIQKQQTELAKDMYHSTREKLMILDDATFVLAAHGAGTLCGKGLSDDNWSTIGQEKEHNPALQDISEAAFVDYLTSEQPYIPVYFPISVNQNKAGNRSVTEAQELMHIVAREDIIRDIPVIDTRSPTEYLMYGHENTINIPLGKQFPTVLGSLYTLDQPVYFIVKHEKDYVQLVTYLLKIGYETIVKGIVIIEHDTINQYTLPEDIDREKICIVDVRSPATVAKNPLFADEVSIRIPLAELVDRIHELPENKLLIPFCGGTYQSHVAMSIIKAYKPNNSIHSFEDILWEKLPLHT